MIDALKKTLPMGTALDGELVAFDEKGRLSFGAMQDASANTNIVFYAFDTLLTRWRNLRHSPLRKRLSSLATAFAPSERVQRSEHFIGPAEQFLSAVRQIGGEGVIAKRLDSPYEPGKRSGAWTKTRFNVGQEFVIGGFTAGSNGIDALVVGFYRDHKLLYVARVRAGMVPATRRELYSRLKPHITQNCPFANLPEAQSGRWGQGLTAAKMRGCIWVHPKAIANFEFLEWTDSNHVRHIKFVGLRGDKKPPSVMRE
jgi:ATP-dependent DNA ligase